MNEILNRLEKTKLEKFPDLAAEKEGRDREERNEKKAQIQEMKRKEKEEMKKKRELDELRYDGSRAPVNIQAPVLTELLEVAMLMYESPSYRGVGCE